MEAETLGIAFLVGLVAFLYASVGHGGASGYLAILSFFAFSRDEMASTALMLNVLVAGLAFWFYRRANYFAWRLLWPFLATSIPFAFIGGLLPVDARIYYALLALALAVAAYRMLGRFGESLDGENPAPLPLKWTLPSGAAIGLVSGIVGVGGGIFLSPLMLLSRWASVKQTAATSAPFIVLNAAAGLLGRLSRDAVVVGNLWPLLITGFIGGLLGAYFGANRFSPRALRALLAAVLVIAAFKLVRQALG